MVAKQLEYAERVTYWIAAGRVFALHPVLGVGLGNSGFYFREVIPATSYDLLDVLGAVGQFPGPFPNPKSLWFRLLAESGLVGFIVFLTWLVMTFASAWAVTRRSLGLASVIGLATLLSLVALVVEGLSLDTFALPYVWLLPGMAAGLWKPASPKVDPG
jgi:O-antigen ligase